MAELCKRYERASGELNYLNFTPAEREHIMTQFATLRPILRHHVRIGDLLLPLALDRTEQAYFSAILLYTAGAPRWLHRSTATCTVLGLTLISRLYILNVRTYYTLFDEISSLSLSDMLRFHLRLSMSATRHSSATSS